MAAQRSTATTVIRIGLGILTGFATAIGVFAGGCQAAIVYYKAADMLQTNTLTATLHDKESELSRKQNEIQALQKQLADSEQQRNALFAKLQMMPTNDDFETVCFRTMELYAHIRSAFYPTLGRPTVTITELSNLQKTIADAVAVFFTTLNGANIIRYKEVSGTRWVFIKKYPLAYVNDSTGELRTTEPQ